MIEAMRATLIKSSILLACLLALSACGSGTREVRGELPLITLEGLERRADQLSLQLGLRNINDRPLYLGEVSVRLSLAGDELMQGTHTPDFEIEARGREAITVPGRGLAEGLRRLDQFDPEINDAQELPRSIAWQMQISLSDERGRSRDTEVSGFLHPVPGQPGRFR